MIKLRIDMAEIRRKQTTNKPVKAAKPAVRESQTRCPICRATFKNLTNLNKHLTGKHGIKLFEDLDLLGGG